MKNNENIKELHRLRAENKRLRRENEYLRHRTAQFGERTREMGREKAVLSDIFATVGVANAKTYFGFLLYRVRTSRWFRLYDKTSFAVRGFLIASKLWRLMMSIFALVGIGAQVLLLVGIFTILLPAVILFSVIMAIVSFFAYRKWNVFFSEILRDRKVFILFSPKKRGKTDYFSGMTEDLSGEGVVLAISRSFFSGGHLRVMRTESGAYQIPLGYYFSLRARLPAMGAARVIMIH